MTGTSAAVTSTSAAVTSAAGTTSVAGTTSAAGTTSVTAALTALEEKAVPLQSIFESLHQDLNDFKTQITEMQSKVRLLEKTIKKDLKNTEKKKPSISKGALESGFAKPGQVTNELCVFMQKPLGSEIARTEATEYIIQYIRTHKLQDMKNRKKIIPNEALLQLLAAPATELTYFNLQKYLNVHFSKK
jgi:chromatin remodeling complex protein RSC6